MSSVPRRPALLVLLALIPLVLGWRELFFLTDDAYIAFRYVRNLWLGWGLVWNPAPFPPVEGYTSLLWVLLLAALWPLGAAPPLASSILGLLFGVGTLVIAVRMLWRMDLPAHLAPHRTTLLGILLLGMVSHRTFLTWISSGLETSLFNFLVLGWLSAVLTPRRRPRLIAVLAAAIALTRPDGLLYVAASLPLLTPTAALTLLVVPAHLLWRKWTYGLWLPNTYYAKVSGVWPEAGLRYLASYALEHGTWLWAGLGLAALPALLRVRRLPVLIAVGTLLAHVGYYTVRVGGDHFEYRVLSHLTAPLLLSAVWLLGRLTLRPAPVLGLFAALVAASWPVAWVHHAETRDITVSPDPASASVPIAHRFPLPFRPLVAAWDRQQAWLSQHYVCKRRHEHALFLAHIQELLPTEEEGAVLDWERDRVLYWSRSVGWPGWAMPQVAVVDALGLNDPVVAAGPTRASQGLPRRMAHDRSPPDGFLGCFRFNLAATDRRLHPDPSILPMTDAEIRACYEAFAGQH